MTFLVLTVIVLFAIAVVRVMTIAELSAELRDGRRDHVMSDEENKNQGLMWVVFMIAFFGFCIWQVVKYSDKLLPRAASAHGPDIDKLFNFSMILIAVVVVITHIVLVYQTYKNAGAKTRKATYFAHSNKLELIWTVIPAIVLTAMIVYGLVVWNRVIYPSAGKPMVMELYAKQFDWTARYAGKDNELGKADFRSIKDGNDLGLLEDNKADDDVIVKGQFHLVLNKPVLFKFRSRDVIHSAYMPHFRAQMNCVPGMETVFEFTPTITTADMRAELKNEEFNYILLCNKVCGAAHYNMQMDIIVETQAEFDKWMADQQNWMQKQATATAAPVTAELTTVGPAATGQNTEEKN